MDIFGDYLCVPESVKQELLAVASNWPLFKDWDIFPMKIIPVKIQKVQKVSLTAQKTLISQLD